MDRIINGNVVDVMEDNMDAGWKVNRRETVICWCNVDWLSKYNDDWLSEYGKSPWNYSKATGWRVCWDVPKREICILFFEWLVYHDSFKFADFLLSFAYDDKEAY